MTTCTPYTYLIGWSSLDRWYYGVRTAKSCHPNDLMKTYFTSSETVHNMISEFGLPDVIQVRRAFEGETPQFQARLWEATVIRRVGIDSSRWLNRHSPSEGFFIKGPVSDKTKIRMKRAAADVQPIQCPHCMKEVTPGHFRQFHGDRCRDAGYTGSYKVKLDDTTPRVSSSKKPKQKPEKKTKTCEHCLKEVILSAFVRFHGDRCKLTGFKHTYSPESIDRLKKAATGKTKSEETKKLISDKITVLWEKRKARTIS